MILLLVQVIATLSDPKASLADRERALETVRAQKMTQAGPALVRIGTLPDNHENDALGRLRAEAIVALFELADPHAKQAAETQVRRSYPGVSDVRAGIMQELGKLTDAASLE